MRGRHIRRIIDTVECVAIQEDRGDRTEDTALSSRLDDLETPPREQQSPIRRAHSPKSYRQFGVQDWSSVDVPSLTSDAHLSWLAYPGDFLLLNSLRDEM